MRTVHLAYGKAGIDLNLDESWNVEVVEPAFLAGLEDPAGALVSELKRPIGSPRLEERAFAGDRVGIIFNDITRATPNGIILPAILAQLPHIKPENITLFNALGTHRENTREELAGMIGAELASHYRIVQNNCSDRSTQVRLGKSKRGNEIWINRELADCDLKILTGFIEPHFFAGFSGGGKAVMPGMAGLSTILGNHSAANIGDPRAAWGVTDGNPIWEEAQEAALMAGNLFLVNVALNREKAITAVFAGDLLEAHAEGCRYVKTAAMAGVEAPFEIVVTSNSGYPLDLNLYQAVKGMSAAAQVAREGGSILIAAECWDGIPEHGLFKQLLSQATGPKELLAAVHQPGFARQDQWQAQVLAQILLKADVYVHSRGLTTAQIEGAMVKPAPDLHKTLRELVKRYGPGARICVLPEGPVTIPYILQKEKI